MTATMVSRWSTAAIVLAFWAGCATDGTQTKTPAEKPTPAAETPPEEIPIVSEKYGLTGYAVYEVDGRLWVFEAGSEGLVQFVADGEPAKNVTLVGEGPDGKTVKGSEMATLRDYIDSRKYAVQGFAVYGREGRLWVFEDGSPDLALFLEAGEPAKSISLIGEGPDGKTIRSVDKATATAYLAAWKAR